MFMKFFNHSSAQMLCVVLFLFHLFEYLSSCESVMQNLLLLSAKTRNVVQYCMGSQDLEFSDQNYLRRPSPLQTESTFFKSQD